MQHSWHSMRLLCEKQTNSVHAVKHNRLKLCLLCCEADKSSVFCVAAAGWEVNLGDQEVHTHVFAESVFVSKMDHERSICVRQHGPT